VSDSSRTSEETFDNSTVENGRSGSNCYMPHDALMANCEQFLYGWAVGGQVIIMWYYVLDFYEVSWSSEDLSLLA